MSGYAYKLAPIYKEKIWGGRNLERLFARSLPAGVPIGESWELADLPEGQCAVANGARAGQSLRQLVEGEGPALMGQTALSDRGRFPLLLKLLDAADTLSVQVHPDAEAVKAIPSAALKTECWYVLASDGGFIYKGVKPGVTADQFQAALDADAVADLLMRYDVHAGDFHYLPAGTVHALGAGVVVAEVQTPSDTTYRVSDWGRGREIHVQRAMQCIHFTPLDDQPPAAGGDCLLETDYFHVFLRSAGPGTRPVPTGRPTAWMMLEGGGEFRSDGPDGAVPVAPGDTLLLPANLENAAFVAAAAARWLEILLPPFGRQA
jgi:mannose-6-phosphate isomerase